MFLSTTANIRLSKHKIKNYSFLSNESFFGKELSQIKSS